MEIDLGADWRTLNPYDVRRAVDVMTQHDITDEFKAEVSPKLKLAVGVLEQWVDAATDSRLGEPVVMEIEKPALRHVHYKDYSSDEIELLCAAELNYDQHVLTEMLEQVERISKILEP